MTHDTFDTLRPPILMRNGLRARAAPGGERLVMLGDQPTTAGFSTSHLVVWDDGDARASVRLDVPPGINRIADATSQAVIVVQNPRGVPDPRGSHVVILDDPGTTPSFPVDLRSSFRLLDPGYLSSTADQRFYELEPPLTATLLPARLNGAATSGGDYHVTGRQ